MDFQKSRHENLHLALCLALRSDLFCLRKLHGRGSFEIRRQVDEGKTVKLILKKIGRFWARFFRHGSDPVAGCCNHVKKRPVYTKLGKCRDHGDWFRPSEGGESIFFLQYLIRINYKSLCLFLFTRITTTIRDWKGGQGICTFKTYKIPEGVFFQKAPYFTEILMHPSIHSFIQ